LSARRHGPRNYCVATRPDTLIHQLLEDLPPPSDDFDAERAIARYLPQIDPKLNRCFKLLGLIAQHDLDVNARVRRTSSHYVHERTTDFELEVSGNWGATEAEDVALGRLTDDVQKDIGDTIVNINRKIYKALEQDYEYQNSDEVVDDNITANVYEFEEDGARAVGGGFTFAQLDNRAKEAARTWYREGNFDNNIWSETTLEEWKEALEQMGFSDVEIDFSGFWSQGDGASFTAKRFSLQQWYNWWSSALPTERGHPYMDDLFRGESLDEPEDFDLQGHLENPFLRLLTVNGFKRSDSDNGHELWCARQPDGKMLCATCMNPASQTWHLTCYEGGGIDTEAYGSAAIIAKLFPAILARHRPKP